MRTTEIFFVMIVNEIKCHVNTLFSSGGGMHPLHPPPVSAPEYRMRIPNGNITRGW